MQDERATRFFTTQWTLVGEAAREGHPEAVDAMAAIFQTYSKPLYLYVRRTGKGPEDAEDLVQGFFAELMKGNSLKLADPRRGRFRTFLLSALKYYLINDWHREHRLKRGGHIPHISLDWKEDWEGVVVEAEDRRSPDRLFDREWAQALLKKVLDDLEREEPEFGLWKPFLSLSREKLSYREIASELGMTEGAARVAVHRLRKRYRQRVKSEVEGSLSERSMVDDEMKVLFEALRDNSL